MPYFYVCFLLPGIDATGNRPVKRGIPPGIPWFICFTQARESIRVARATRELLKKFAAGYHTFHVPCKWTWDFEGISDFQSRVKMNRFCKTCTDLKLDIDCCWLLLIAATWPWYISFYVWSLILRKFRSWGGRAPWPYSFSSTNQRSSRIVPRTTLAFNCVSCQMSNE